MLLTPNVVCSPTAGAGWRRWISACWIVSDKHYSPRMSSTDRYDSRCPASTQKNKQGSQRGPLQKKEGKRDQKWTTQRPRARRIRDCSLGLPPRPTVSSATAELVRAERPGRSSPVGTSTDGGGVAFPEWGLPSLGELVGSSHPQFSNPGGFPNPSRRVGLVFVRF